MNPPLNLLIIEDQPDDFLLLERHLQHHGLIGRRQLVTDLEDLKAALETSGWDAVLSDYHVPKLDFKDTLRVLQARQPDLPLILVSGSIGEEKAVELLKLGVWDYVNKDNLTRLVSALERSQRESADRRARQAAEAVLRAGEERYRSLFENMLNGFAYCRMIFEQDQPRDFMYLAVNQAFEKLTGLKDVVGRRASEAIPGIREADPELFEIYGRVARTGVPERFEIHVEALKNWFMIAVYSPGRDYFVAVFDVITERKCAEASLRESEVNFRTMFEMAAIGMAQADPYTGRFLRVNQKMCVITGYTMAELLQRNFPELTHPEDRQKDWEANQRLVRGEVPDYRLEKRYVRKDGTIAWVNVNTTLIRDTAGQPVRTMAAIEDITERKRTEQTQARLVTAVEQAAETIVITDLEGAILYANPAFEKSTGYTRAEALGQNPRMLKSDRQDEEFYRRMWTVLGRGETWNGHFINRRKNGTFYEEEATITPVRDAAGQVVNYVAVKRDVTREVQLEAQFRQAQKMEAIGTLAGGIAHDFNNMLAAMFGYCYLLKQDCAGNVSAQENVGEILQAASRAKDLVQQILTFSRQREQPRAVIRLDTVVKEAAKFLRASLPAELKIELNLAEDAPAVLADPTQIYQVAINLATNALHAMEGRPGRLIIQLDSFVPDEPFLKGHPALQPIPYARLTVTDTGRGMDPQTLEHIFEPFFTTKPVGQGTGLGLTVVLGIVQSHEGVIIVVSQPGQGSAFSLFFPARTPDATLTLSAAPPLARGQGQKILFVDDEPVLTAMYQRLLSQLNYQVTISNSAHEALRWCGENPARFDLVITDLTMPDLNGLELARRLHALRPGLPLILTSGSSGPPDEESRHAAGIGKLIEKPITLPVLAEAVFRALAKT